MLEDGAWADKAAIIVGGGPSLKTFNWSLLVARSRVIVINRALVDVPDADIFITEDERFVRRFAKQLRSFRGIKVFSCPDPSYGPIVLSADPSVIVIHTREKKHGWSSHLIDGLSTSSNSAIPALNLADILGASDIYLLGIDSRCDGPTMANYHADYPQSWATGRAQLESFKSDFEHWAAPHLRHRRIWNVINPACPSALLCWPRITFEDFARVLKGKAPLAVEVPFNREAAVRYDFS